jgi:hypothetical protein
MTKRIIAAVLVGLLGTPALAEDVPRFQVEASWPKPLPNDWILGQVAGDLLPELSSFIGRICSGYAPLWGVLRTRSV